MQRTKLWVILLFGLLSLTVLTLDSGVKSQLPLSNVSINADGSIEPSTAPITYSGGIYTLTGNISGGLVIHRSNIVIDGAGYALNGNGKETCGVDLRNNVIAVPSAQEIWNVTVKHLAIINFDFSIDTNGGGNDTFYNLSIAKNLGDLRGGIFLWACSGNNITHCTVNGDPAVYMHFCSNNNSVVENNLSGGASVEVSGNEIIDRNYWVDYRIKYPNATEVDSTGVWNTPYQASTASGPFGTIQDNHPQKNPFTQMSTAVPEYPSIAFLPLLLIMLITIVTSKRKPVGSSVRL